MDDAGRISHRYAGNLAWESVDKGLTRVRKAA
jgi:hypothetical protein